MNEFCEDFKVISSLYSYLKELWQLKSKAIRTFEQYENVLWLSKVKNEDKNYSIFNDLQDEIIKDKSEKKFWVKISQTELISPPPPEHELLKWINSESIKDSSREKPELLETIFENDQQSFSNNLYEYGENTEIVKLKLSNNPQIINEFNDYVKNSWKPWAKKDRKKKRQIENYKNIFSIYNQYKQLNESFEVVLGLGLLNWELESTHQISRHIFTIPVDLKFIQKEGTLKIYPLPFSEIHIEQDMLPQNSRPTENELINIREDLPLSLKNAWENGIIPELLMRWINSVPTGTGRYLKNFIGQNNKIRNNPILTLSPAIILRKRPATGYIKTFQTIIKQIEENECIPDLVRKTANLQIEEKEQIEKKEDNYKPDIDLIKYYFPKPANEQQRKIIDLLDKQDGVVVQGPPGTGKSHTIANLICHLLALGKRILVTSQAGRALKVLRNFMPNEIQDLCVSVLGSDHESISELKKSVNSINNELGNWDQEQVNVKIENLYKELDDTYREQSKISSEIESLRKEEINKYSENEGGYGGTLTDIGKQIHRTRCEYNWIESCEIPEAKPDDDPPVSKELLIKFLKMLKDRNIALEKDAKKDLPELNKIIDPPQFANICTKEKKLRKNLDAYSSLISSHNFKRLRKSLNTEDAEYINKRLELLKSKLGKVKSINIDWVTKAIQDVLSNRKRKWQHLMESSVNLIKEIDPKLEICNSYNVKGVNTDNCKDVKSSSEPLLAHFKQGKGTGFWIFRKRVVKEAMYIIKNVTIDKKACDDKETLEKLLLWITTLEKMDHLRILWSDIQDIDHESFGMIAATVKDLNAILRSIHELDQIKHEIKERTKDIDAVEITEWHKEENLSKYIEIIKAIRLDLEIENCIDPLKSNLEILRSFDLYKVPETINKLIESIENRDPKEYSFWYNKLDDLHKEKAKFELRCQLKAKIDNYSTKLTETIEENYNDDQFTDQINNFEDAWYWLQTSRWLEEKSSADREEILNKKYESIKLKLKNIINEIVAYKSWHFCIKRMKSDKNLQSNLKGWAKAIDNIGKGYSKYIERKRRVAREQMDKCKMAVPAWIMPLDRITETIEPTSELFDVVIIDEASQSGPETLLLQYLAKKIVVVGDNKQISPSWVGVKKEDVYSLIDKHLSGFPQNSALGVESSFFDYCNIRYHSMIRLREHFRCMPEIIQFCNDNFYDDTESLIPLRQYGSKRLTPVLNTIYIDDGYAEGKRGKINPPEAEALVNNLKDCINNEAYKGKSMGVISLLGKDQASYIEGLVMEQISAKEIEDRRIICGDAYTFQGDERDVIFISMVAALSDKNQNRLRPYSSKSGKQRFNVAVSRAKDQIFLFHSVNLNNLKPECLRFKLIKYMNNPYREKAPYQETSFDPDILQHEYFDSLFEQHVYLRINEKGYRVIPQYEIHGYRIDLVVEGLDGKLAIECDGDKWHGIEQYRHDMARQRELERCGLHFWRIRGSEFYRDPEKSLEGLWKELDKRGIYPVSKEKRAIKKENEAIKTEKSFEVSEEDIIPDKECPLCSNSEIVKGVCTVCEADLNVLNRKFRTQILTELSNFASDSIYDDYYFKEEEIREFSNKLNDSPPYLSILRDGMLYAFEKIQNKNLSEIEKRNYAEVLNYIFVEDDLLPDDDPNIGLLDDTFAVRSIMPNDYRFNFNSEEEDSEQIKHHEKIHDSKTWQENKDNDHIETEAKTESINTTSSEEIVAVMNVSDSREFRFYFSQYRGNTLAHIREHLETSTFSGYTKRGIALNLDQVIDIFEKLDNLEIEGLFDSESTIMTINKNNNTDIFIRTVRYQNRGGLDLREYLDTSSYQGWTKKGIRIQEEDYNDFISCLARLKAHL